MPANFPNIKSFYDLGRFPVYTTVIAKFGNKVEQRLALDPNPGYIFKLRFPYLLVADADTIMAFFMARKGSYEAFYLQAQDEAYRGKKWTASTVYSVGSIVRPTTMNGRSYKCTTAGTSGSTEPSWPTTYKGQVSDNGVVWTENSYLVRFSADVLEARYVAQDLYDYGEITMEEVSA